MELQNCSPSSIHQQVQPHRFSGSLGWGAEAGEFGAIPIFIPILIPIFPIHITISITSPHSHHRCHPHPHPHHQPHPLSIPITITITTYPSPSPADTYQYQPGPNWLPNVPKPIPKMIPLSSGAIGGGGSGCRGLPLKHGGVGTVGGDLRVGGGDFLYGLHLPRGAGGVGKSMSEGTFPTPLEYYPHPQYLLLWISSWVPWDARCNGHQLISAGNQGNPWISMDIQRYQCVSMGSSPYPWISVGSQAYHDTQGSSWTPE